MPRGVFDVSVLGIRTSRFSTTLNSVEHLITVKIDPHGHQSLKFLDKSFLRSTYFMKNVVRSGPLKLKFSYVC